MLSYHEDYRHSNYLVVDLGDFVSNNRDQVLGILVPIGLELLYLAVMYVRFCKKFRGEY